MSEKHGYDTFYSAHTWQYGATQPLRELRNLSAHHALPDPPLQGKSALDLGCGLGEYTRALARIGFGTVLGIDLSHTAIERVERHEPKEPGVRYLCADFLEAAWEERAFDFVLVRGFSPFNTADIGALDEMIARFQKLLRPAGSIAIANPSRACSGGKSWYSWSVQEVEDFRTLAFRHFASVDICFFTRLSRSFFPVLRFHRRNAAALRFLCRMLRRSVVLAIVLRRPHGAEAVPPAFAGEGER